MDMGLPFLSRRGERSSRGACEKNANLQDALEVGGAGYGHLSFTYGARLCHAHRNLHTLKTALALQLPGLCNS